MSTKPNTTGAMRKLIHEVKTTLPLDLSPVEVCSDECKSCSIKLIEYIAMELENWESRLDDGDIPNFRDLNRLAKSSQKIYRALLKNGLIDDPL
ncbi:MAG: hypothetical protein OEY09_08535 [Gammaproteobacteria bacterium]|nr:hypothetical protein [Gammaproteobacteria bacterium]